MEQELCNTLQLAGQSRLSSDADNLINVTLTPGQIKQIFLTLEIFQLQYGSHAFTKKMADIESGILDTLRYHAFDVMALKLDAKSYIEHEFNEIRQQFDQGINQAEKMERCYAS